MNDPHVEALMYDLQTGYEFLSPPSLVWETQAFKAELADGILTVELLGHYANSKDAREVVEPHLDSWEIHAALSYGRREIRFAYRCARVVDRDPIPEGSVLVEGLEVKIQLGDVTVSAFCSCNMKAFPPPPTNFKVDPDVLSLWNRYEHHRNGHEPLASMAYFCCTLLTQRFGGDKGVEVALAVGKNVLSRIRKLSSSRGDLATARKVTDGLTPYNAGDREWLEAAVVELIRRTGQFVAGHKSPLLTVDQLPGHRASDR